MFEPAQIERRGYKEGQCNQMLSVAELAFGRFVLVFPLIILFLLRSSRLFAQQQR